MAEVSVIITVKKTNVSEDPRQTHVVFAISEPVPELGDAQVYMSLGRTKAKGFIPSDADKDTIIPGTQLQITAVDYTPAETAIEVAAAKTNFIYPYYGKDISIVSGAAALAAPTPIGAGAATPAGTGATPAATPIGGAAVPAADPSLAAVPAATPAPVVPQPQTPELTVDSIDMKCGKFLVTIGLFLNEVGQAGVVNIAPDVPINLNGARLVDPIDMNVPETGRLQVEMEVDQRTNVYLTVEQFNKEYTFKFSKPRYTAKEAEETDPPVEQFFSGWQTGKKVSRAYGRLVFSSLVFIAMITSLSCGYLGWFGLLAAIVVVGAWWGMVYASSSYGPIELRRSSADII